MYNVGITHIKTRTCYLIIVFIVFKIYFKNFAFIYLTRKTVFHVLDDIRFPSLNSILESVRSQFGLSRCFPHARGFETCI